MTANFHTHTVFCDGKNTPEEIVLKAIEKGFSAIGFSGHGYTPFDLSYCMKDTEEYISEIHRLKERYKKDIEVYLGAEEDAFAPVDRSRFDYIIGSSHYVFVKGKYYAVDSGYDGFKKCLESFDYDTLSFSEAYYSSFVNYIIDRKPDVIGHFDLITKYDELDSSMFLEDEKYNLIAEKYITKATQANCIFEVNTGAVSRGLRKTVYPFENLLYILKRNNARVMLSSDSHKIDTLDYGFTEAKKILHNIGFRHLYTLRDNKFVKYDI